MTTIQGLDLLAEIALKPLPIVNIVAIDILQFIRQFLNTSLFVFYVS